MEAEALLLLYSIPSSEKPGSTDDRRHVKLVRELSWLSGEQIFPFERVAFNPGAAHCTALLKSGVRVTEGQHTGKNKDPASGAGTL